MEDKLYPTLFINSSLQENYIWLCKLREFYSANSDIWNFRKNWTEIQQDILLKLNSDNYTFDPLIKYMYPNQTPISLWSSKDMLALKLISLALYDELSEQLSKSCFHLKGHGGLKAAVKKIHINAIENSEYKYVMRSDIKSYYESIRFDSLLEIIKEHTQHPVLLSNLEKALKRTETWGGLFESYDTKGIPKGSPLSPLLAGIALLPLDKAMEQIPDILYVRYMDDWVVLTKTKSALRKVIKRTHAILDSLGLQMHPSKTWIGKIEKGFNFLGYYFDNKKLLIAQETLRRFYERSNALYEQELKAEIQKSKQQQQQQEVDVLKIQKTQKKKKILDKWSTHQRDVSEYHVNESPPKNESIKNKVEELMEKVSQKPTINISMRRYFNKWFGWVQSGLNNKEESSKGDIEGISYFLKEHLPDIFLLYEKTRSDCI